MTKQQESIKLLIMIKVLECHFSLFQSFNEFYYFPFFKCAFHTPVNFIRINLDVFLLNILNKFYFHKQFVNNTLGQLISWGFKDNSLTCKMCTSVCMLIPTYFSIP